MESSVSPAKLLEELGARVSELLAGTPAKDFEKNLKALLIAGFSRLDLVTREEFEVQQALLLATQQRLDTLEKRLSCLETSGKAVDE